MTIRLKRSEWQIDQRYFQFVTVLVKQNKTKQQNKIIKFKTGCIHFSAQPKGVCTDTAVCFCCSDGILTNHCTAEETRTWK